MSQIDRPAAASLLRDFSLEMTGKDVPGLIDAVPHLPRRTRVNVTFLGNEDLGMRVAAAAAVKESGLVPVPHISARRIVSADDLGEFLAALRAQELSEHVFVVGGDPSTPAGPYASSLDLIRSGELGAHGVREIGIAGYPEGHPDISDDSLWAAIVEKSAEIASQGLDGVIITQFGFDTEPVYRWLEQLRGRGIDLPVRIGVPGPAGIKRLVSFAARFGVNSSASIAKKYGFSLTNLLGTAGPDAFIRSFADGLDGARHGDVGLHFYTFGGIPATASWIETFEASVR